MWAVRRFEFADLLGVEPQLECAQGIFQMSHFAGAYDWCRNARLTQDPRKCHLGIGHSVAPGDLGDLLDNMEIGIVVVEGLGVFVGLCTKSLSKVLLASVTCKKA